MAVGLKKARMAIRQAKTATMYLQGFNLHEIAAKLGHDANAGTVMAHRDIAAVKQEWRHSAIRDFDEARGQQLAKLELLEKVLWAEWEKSQKETKETTNKLKKIRSRVNGRMMNGGEENTVKKEKRCGDSRYTAQIMECISLENELLGLVVKKPDDISAPPPAVVSLEIRCNVPVEQSAPIPVEALPVETPSNDSPPNNNI